MSAEFETVEYVRIDSTAIEALKDQPGMFKIPMILSREPDNEWRQLFHELVEMYPRAEVLGRTNLEPSHYYFSKDRLTALVAGNQPNALEIKVKAVQDLIDATNGRVQKRFQDRLEAQTDLAKRDEQNRAERDEIVRQLRDEADRLNSRQ